MRAATPRGKITVVREQPRPRHYLAPPALTLARPLFRYSLVRDAYVFWIVGDRFGPVLKRDRRRRRPDPYAGRERRAAPQT